MNNKRRSLLTIFSAATLGAIALLAPNVSRADFFGISSIGFSVVQWITYYIAYLISIIGEIIFVIETFFLSFILELNYSIVNSPSVQLGFSIVLAFANILFVAAIIFMAVSTIIRYDSYGYKQILWKIVVAAIGVNFSLILAGTVINFADQATKFFMNNSVYNPTATSGRGAGDFAEKLAGAFNPQQMFLTGGLTSSAIDGTKKDEDTVQASLTSNVGGVYGAIAGVMLTAAMVVLMAIFFGVLIAAFFIRYIMLSLLLVIMPAVWLAWIFPFGRGLVNYWRDKFVKWTFFAPMSMAFLYLSMKSVDFLASSGQIKGFIEGNLKGSNSADKSISAFLFKTFAELQGPLLGTVLNFVLVAGTLYGGLYFSSKLGIKAAGAGAKAFESLGNSVKRRAQTSARDFGMRNADRLRTSFKDKNGNSALTRGASWVATSNNGFAKALRSTQKLGVPVTGMAQSVAKAGKLDSDEVNARVKRLKDGMSGLTNDALHVKRERIASGSLKANAEEERAVFEMLKDRKELGSIAKRHKASIEAAQKAEHGGVDADGKPIDPKNASGSLSLDSDKREKEIKDNLDDQLRAQIKRLAAQGATKDLFAANPQLAMYAPPKEIEVENEKGEKIKRLQTEGEMRAEAIRAIKKDEDMDSLIALDPEVFGGKGSAAPTEAQMQAVAVLTKQQLKKIGEQNLELLSQIQKTATHMKETIRKDAESRRVAGGALSSKLDTFAGLKLTADAVFTKSDSLLQAIEKDVHMGARLDEHLHQAISQNKNSAQAGSK